MNKIKIKIYQNESVLNNVEYIIRTELAPDYGLSYSRVNSSELDVFFPNKHFLFLLFHLGIRSKDY